MNPAPPVTTTFTASERERHNDSTRGPRIRLRVSSTYRASLPDHVVVERIVIRHDHHGVGLLTSSAVNSTCRTSVASGGHVWVSDPDIGAERPETLRDHQAGDSRTSPVFGL